ncbi:MAG: polysaccharide biosynthesis protein [candidate division WS6 bacterium GW2011_GWF2_33_92]|uniref:Polysaccharide biosynthesis protein n=2 Tax=Candidatus Dojkabacteria TaxID=74243 RepID=A0A0G0DGT9_9BACT|nr:MAG: polysaccharide biosynthesis protein [candidate division WS6 bacterium GW2011_GWB1_33_6]KKP56647.1 MAG: polysaccharide biosynthesis protein [candidate division WS6 bacterium GW2011_GWF2_33_92]HBB64413.1 hypothetical protein [Patescibacteria group bacterium]
MVNLLNLSYSYLLYPTSKIYTMNIGKHIREDRVFVNNILITIFFGVIVNLLNYLFSVFLARSLDASHFGLYNAALGIITLVQIPAIAIQTAITKRVASNKNFNLEKFKLKSTIQLVIVATVLSLLFYASGKYISDIANIPISYIPALTLVVFGAIVSPIAKGFLLGLEKILSFNIITLLETALKFIFGFLAIYMEADITLVILAFALPSIITSLFVLPLTKTKSDIQPTKEIKLNYRQISLIFVTFFLLNVPFTLDLILVNPEVRASYGALSLLGKIVYFGSVTIASLMISKLANSKKHLRKRTLLISLVVSGLTGITITGIYCLFSTEIVNIVFGGMYLDIVEYLVPYAIGMTAYALSYMVITSLLVDDSYIHIYFLVFVTLLQIVLYQMNNTTLYDAVINQFIVYGVLSLFVFLILIFYIFKKNGKESKGST